MGLVLISFLLSFLHLAGQIGETIWPNWEFPKHSIKLIYVPVNYNRQLFSHLLGCYTCNLGAQW